MEWINIKSEQPKVSGPFLISISKKYSNGEYIFNYYAFFDIQTSKWFKYNSEDNSIGEEIKEKINGWLKDLTNFLV